MFGLTDRQVRQLTDGWTCHVTDGMTEGHSWEFT